LSRSKKDGRAAGDGCKFPADVDNEPGGAEPQVGFFGAGADRAGDLVPAVPVEPITRNQTASLYREIMRECKVRGLRVTMLRRIARLRAGGVRAALRGLQAGGHVFRG